MTNKYELVGVALILLLDLWLIAPPDALQRAANAQSNPVCTSKIVTVPCYMTMAKCRPIVFWAEDHYEGNCLISSCVDEGIIACTGMGAQEFCFQAGLTEVADVMSCTTKPMTC